jgi:hypothetical protein
MLGVGIEPVNIEEIDIVHAETAERLVDLVEDVLARQPAVIGPSVAHPEAHLGRHHDLVAPCIGLERLAGDFLGIAEIVMIGGVEEIDPALDSPCGRTAAPRLPGSPRDASARPACRNSCNQGTAAKPSGLSFPAGHSPCVFSCHHLKMWRDDREQAGPGQ